MTRSPLASPDNARRTLETMWTIRRFEEAVDDLFARGLMHGTMHLSIGQEASATGACLALRDDDAITSTHRGHGHCIAKGADLVRMMAELLAKETGYCRGRGGSMHIADVATGNLGANGIVAGGIPIAAGAALAYQMRGEDRVVACFFGDGATNEGAFHEAVNLAAIWKLPVVFVCENNKYGMSFSTEKSMADRAHRRARRGLRHPRRHRRRQRRASRSTTPCRRPSTGPAPARARRWSRRSPTAGRATASPTRTSTAPRTRSPSGATTTRSRDFEREAVEAGLLTEDGRRRRPRRRSIEDAPRRRPRRPTPPPTPTPPTCSTPSSRPPEPRDPCTVEHHHPRRAPASRVITYSEAVREAIGQAMEADDRVFMLGEDIGVYGGAFGVSGDLYHRFGAERIRDTPISELGIVGAAVGAALAGMRPIVEIQFSDFTNQAMDQIVNQAAKIHFMLGGAVQRADGAARPARLRHRRRRPALPEPRGVVRPRARPQGGHAGHRRRRQGPAARRHRRPQPGHRARAQAALPRVRARCPTEAVRVPARARPPSAAPARDLTIVATGVMVSRVAGGRRGRSPPRASTSRSSTRAP